LQATQYPHVALADDLLAVPLHVGATSLITSLTNILSGGNSGEKRQESNEEGFPQHIYLINAGRN
jgi:hypothetical protein